MDSWVTESLPAALSYASSLLGDRGMGEDIVHDCICRILARSDHYDLGRDGRRILFRSITNACLNHRNRQRRHLSLDEEGRPPKGGAWEMEDSRAASPPDLAMAEELREAIEMGLSTLPVRQRSALELSSLGFRTEEIAEILEAQPENVRMLLHRARRAMASYLNDRFFEGVKP